MTLDEIESALIDLAAQCLRGDNLPPEYVGDWGLPKKTSNSVFVIVQMNNTCCREAALEWGRKLKKLADEVRRIRKGTASDRT